MASTTKTTERIPQYYHQWKADDRFPELNKALETHRANLQKCQELKRTINFKIDNTDTYDPAIRILDDLDSDLVYGNAGCDSDTNQFARKYQGIIDIDEDLSHSFEEALAVLREAKRKHLAEIPKLEEELKVAEFAKDRDYKTYRELDDKYEAEFDKLLEAQKEEDAKKSQEEVAA